MEQVRALKDILHADGLRKAGHIFKVPDDMDFETATRLVAKEIVTDCIEVLEEPAGETTITLDDSMPAGVTAGETGTAGGDEPVDDEGSGEPGEEVTELGDDTREDDGDEGEAGGEAGDGEPGEEEQAVDIATLTKKELKAELKVRGLSTSGNKDDMYERLKAVVDVKDDGGEGEAGEE